MRETGSRPRVLPAMAVAVAGISLWVVFAYLVAPLLVRYAYQAEGLPLLDAVLAGRETHSVELYLDAWNKLADGLTKILLPVAAVAVLLAQPAVESRLARTFGAPEPLHVRQLISARRLFMIYGAISMIVGGSAIAIATDTERWPFSNYTMYAQTATAHFRTVRLLGVTEDGRQEVPLEARSLRPFYHGRLTEALRRMFVQEGLADADARTAFSYLLGRYETLRQEGVHSGPRLCGLRLYETEWRLEPGAAGELRPVDRRLLGQQVDCPGGSNR